MEINWVLNIFPSIKSYSIITMSPLTDNLLPKNSFNVEAWEEMTGVEREKMMFQDSSLEVNN